MKILFIHYVSYLQSDLPEGVALLSAILKRGGHSVELFDTTFMKPENYGRMEEKDKSSVERVYKTVGIHFYKQTPYGLKDLTANDPVIDIEQKFAETVKRFNPDLIAVSAMTTNYDKSLELLRRSYALIKSNNPDCKIVFGGPHATLMPADVINEPEVDFACVGEGDEALPELCECLEQGKDVSGIKNLYVKVKSGNDVKIIKNNLRPYVDLDTLPPPDLSLFDPRHFFRAFEGKVYTGIFSSTSRGCPRGCAFCVNKRLQTMFKECGPRYLRFQTPKKVAENLEYLKMKYGIIWHKFSDDTFLMRSLKDLQELKVLLKPLNIMFACSADPATITEEKALLAKEMGCVSMSLGIESGNEDIRRHVLGKQISNDQIIKAVRILQGLKIKISAFNLMGVPGETKENVFETIRFNKKLGVPNANIYIVYPFAGTKIYDDHKVNLYRNGHLIPMEEGYEFGLSKMSKDDLLFFLRTFNLFLVMPEEYWGRIERTRENPQEYPELVRIAQDIVDKKNAVDNF